MDKVKSVEEYIFELKRANQNLLTGEEIPNIWYRGESSNTISTPLIPKIYRQYNDPDAIQAFEFAKQIETNIKSEFRIKANSFFQKLNIENTYWNNYFLMQHYGLETRLLDWTESALIALFFAIENLSCDDAVIWLLNPHKLNKHSTKLLRNNYSGTSTLISPVDSDGNELFNQEAKLNLNELANIYLKLNSNIKSETYNQLFPLALIPSILDERMNLQSSRFTIFGNVVNGLLSIPQEDRTSFLSYIEVDGSFKRQIKDELRLLGVSNYTIYPDLSGLCKSISDKYDVSDHILKKK